VEAAGSKHYLLRRSASCREPIRVYGSGRLRTKVALGAVAAVLILNVILQVGRFTTIPPCTAHFRHGNVLFCSPEFRRIGTV
jgi:hypothetical protein